MSFNATKSDFWQPQNDDCDLAATQPMDLNHEHMLIFNQQQLQTQNQFQNGQFNQWAGYQQPHMTESSGISSHADGYAFPFMLPNEIGMEQPVLFKNGSVSTVSSPSVPGHVANHEYSSPPAELAGKKKPRKKPFLDEREASLIEKDDSELNEDELVVKKKAQNRLAQRAFRERKETRLKDLETKLLQSEEERQKLLEKLDEIKLQYISVRTENSLLRSGSENASSFGQQASLQSSKFVFPQSQDEFIHSMVDTTQHTVNPATMNKVYDEPLNPGRKVLAVGAVWDYLQIKSEEEEYEGVDLMEVMELLKGNEACHGYGPAYPLELVDGAIERVKQQSQ